MELIPVHARTGAVLPIHPVDHASRAEGAPGDAAPASTPLLASFGAAHGWTAATSPAGAPAWRVPGGGAVSYEPGGQIELSSAPHASVDALLAWLAAIVEPLSAFGAEREMRFVARGFHGDPHGDPGQPALRVPRYLRQAAHYDRIGSYGRRMMLRSAGIHVNLDLGDRPLDRWRAALRAVPGWLALFANSPAEDRAGRTHRSWRAAQWRRLDPSRTGLPTGGSDPVRAYLDFALGALAFLEQPECRSAEPFARHVARGVDAAAWERHLTTLFPEVRPRGYLELRCFDALPPRWWGVPAVLAAGLLYHEPTLDRVLVELPAPDPALLERAGRVGLADPEVRRLATAVCDLGLVGAAALPAGLVSSAAVDVARAYRGEYLERGRDPGDDPGAGLV